VSRRRSRRDRRVPRSRTLAVKKITREDLRVGHNQSELDQHAATPRPRTRAECPIDRPCPWVACEHHLYLDVDPETGSIKINFPSLDFDELAETCALDVADAGGATLERVGELMNVTRERVRQLEVAGLFELKQRLAELKRLEN
jgi:hypothetical protein